MVRCAGFTYGVAEVQTIYSAMENAEPFGFDPPVLILCRLPVPIWTTGFDCRFCLSGASAMRLSLSVWKKCTGNVLQCKYRSIQSRLWPFTNRNKRGDIGLARVGTAGDALGNRLLCAITTCHSRKDYLRGWGR